MQACTAFHQAWHYFSCDIIAFLRNTFMNKTASNRSLLQLLVKLYNQTIQSYYHFPEVILCGRHRLEPEEFECLVREGLLEAFYADSFGRLYHLSKTAHEILAHNISRRRSKPLQMTSAPRQVKLPFY
jgi:hypothetical protein